MFLTQILQPKRSSSSTHSFGYQTLDQVKFHSKLQISSQNTSPKHSHSQNRSAKRSSTIVAGYERTLSAINGRLTA